MIGVNVVRGGLFRDNGYSWGLGKEVEYLGRLCEELSALGATYRLYTNGSTLDDNALLYLMDALDLSPDVFDRVDTGRMLLKTIAGYDAVSAIRMHSSIVSYALGIPSLNLVWNRKIPEFYEAIGRRERAYGMEDADPARVARNLVDLANEPRAAPNRTYLMSLYHFLYCAVRPLVGQGAQGEYEFREVVDRLVAHGPVPGMDGRDLDRKIYNGESRYLNLYQKQLRLESELKRHKKELASQKKRLEDAQQAITVRDKTIAKQRERLERIDASLPMRAYHMAKKAMKRH